MKIITKEISGDLEVVENCQYNQIKVNNLIVNEGVRTRLFGHVSGKLIVKNGAIVYLHGEVLGEIVNEGGEVRLYQ